MRKNLRWKALLILAVIGLFVWSLYPPEEKIKLGLDLKGGIHLIMKVNTEDAINAITDDSRDRIAALLDDESVGFEDLVKVRSGELTLAGLESGKSGELRTLLENNFDGWDVTGSGTEWTLTMRDTETTRLKEETVTQSIETIRRRVDALGVSEPLIAPHGNTGNQILIQLPGFDDVARAKSIIKETAKLDLKLVVGQGAIFEDQLRENQPDGTEILEQPAEEGRDAVYYLVERIPVITGRDLKNARPSLDYETNTPNVSFTLKPEAASKFQTVTRENIGRQLAIVLDNKIRSAPSINGAIYDQGQITGNFSSQEALDLALVLRSGALPASLEYQEERTVGPQLGEDSIRSGVTASLVGLAFVVVFILLYYRLSGINAVVALVLNLLILVGAMAYFAATLTLPGIAGVILIIGMGVDANVLIFERIKEEMRGGKTPRTAISAGFGKVFWTIFDANVTSLLAAIILFQFGTGPVQGFAVTLGIGLLSNMFTAIFVSRFLFDFALSGRRQVEALSI